MKYIFLLLFCFAYQQINAQQSPSTKNDPGIIIGNVLDDENGKGLPSVTVAITRISDSVFTNTFISEKDGAFIFESLLYGYYRLHFTAVGYAPLTIDSIYIRMERFDFDLNEIRLKKKNTVLQEVIIYAEKPLIENKDGKIIFNVGESALSSGTSTTELLKQTPLVNIDNDGKVMLRGKDVKVLIDDKPVELNAKQLQDLLESMPGSMIDKIEVMTTPPPQYANERGGVINIVTKKGRVGMNGRIGLTLGTRGEAGINGNFGYRKQRFAINANAGFGYNQYSGNSYSNRQNIYTDSTNYFNTIGNSNSHNQRPNARLSVDYDINKRNSLNFTFLYNSNDAENNNNNEYSNLNQYSALYKLSDRYISSTTESATPNFNLTYSIKGKDPREVLKIIGGMNFNNSQVNKDYFQQFFNPDSTFTGIDSTQTQKTHVTGSTTTFRLNYDRPLGKNFSLNTGGNYSNFLSHNTLNTEFLKKPELIFIPNLGLSNNFRFHTSIYALRAALRYDIIQDFYISAGVQVEQTVTGFVFKDDPLTYPNNYFSALPFATIMKKWKNDVNLTFSYKRSIQRPGINELNPSVDYSDPYNRRFGNPYLLPYFANSFDLIVGKWNKLYYINGSVGYDIVTGLYSSIRTLQADGKTDITWQNLSGRQEYQVSMWGGYTLSKKSKANLSAGYTYNVYGSYDIDFNKFRNGGSVYATLNGSYQFNTVWSSNASFTYNRFANPQGTIKNALSMNVGVQKKFLNKKLSISFNMIDPFVQPQNNSSTYGSNYILQSFSTTRTRNFRLGVSYNFNKKKKSKTEERMSKQKADPSPRSGQAPEQKNK